jgi:hypothetical protein
MKTSLWSWSQKRRRPFSKSLQNPEMRTILPILAISNKSIGTGLPLFLFPRILRYLKRDYPLK